MSFLHSPYSSWRSVKFPSELSNVWLIQPDYAWNHNPGGLVCQQCGRCSNQGPTVSNLSPHKGYLVNLFVVFRPTTLRTFFAIRKSYAENDPVYSVGHMILGLNHFHRTMKAYTKTMITLMTVFSNLFATVMFVGLNSLNFKLITTSLGAPHWLRCTSHVTFLEHLNILVSR